jgi:hypothetical protein
MIRYAQHKKGLFNIDTNVYDVTGERGWIQKEEESVIVGETYDCYITRFLTTSTGYWDDNGKYEAHYTMAIGIHKSRFIKWLPFQIKLF